MNPPTPKEAKSIFSAIKKTASSLRNVETIICPPAVYISELRKIVSGHRCTIGAQDVSYDRQGAHTGEVSVKMLRGLGVGHVVIGHSERRAKGETDEDVNKKVTAVLKEGLSAIVCVGESERDDHGVYTKFIESQIRSALRNVKKNWLGRVIIAYEPLWAIGKDAPRAANPEDVLESSILIRKIISDMFGIGVSNKVAVLYGGSVDHKNTQGFLDSGEADGLLVGRASVESSKFIQILHVADSIKKEN